MDQAPKMHPRWLSQGAGRSKGTLGSHVTLPRTLKLHGSDLKVKLWLHSCVAHLSFRWDLGTLEKSKFGEIYPFFLLLPDFHSSPKLSGKKICSLRGYFLRNGNS